MGYLFSAIAIFCALCKGGFGKVVSRYTNEYRDAVVSNLMRMLLCIAIGFGMVALNGGASTLAVSGQTLLIAALSGIVTSAFIIIWLFAISSCVSIRTRFGCVFLRHCIVKILANASALAPFLPRIVAKTQHRKFFEPKQDKIDCFSRRQVAGILTYFKTDNVEKRLFYLILASSDTNATA